MITHQRNHHRIAELRRTAASLDEATRTAIRLLAGLRKEMQGIPPLPSMNSDASTSGAQSLRSVQIEELLSYARFISKTTVPPTLRKAPATTTSFSLPNSASPAQHEGQNSVHEVDVHMTNGIVTPPPGTQDVKDGGVNAPGSANTTSLERNIGVKTLGEGVKEWLNPANLPFEPWPSQEKIQGGALADIQRMRERGEDPASVLTAEEKERKEAKDREEEERERREQEERMAKYDLGPASGAARRMGSVNEVPFNPDDL